MSVRTPAEETSEVEVVAVAVDDSQAAAIEVRLSEFLVNEHFQVISADGGVHGDTFIRHLVKVSSAALPDERLQSLSAPLEVFTVSRSGRGDSVRLVFCGDAREPTHLDELLTTLTRVCLDQEARDSVRSIIDVRADELMASTNRRYADPEFARSYAQRWRDELPVEQMKRFLDLTPADGSYLDLGAGPCHHARFFAGAKRRVAAVDLSAEALRAGREVADGVVHQLQADALALPFSDGSFDGIWACAVLVHLPMRSIRIALSEVQRVLKVGGVVAFSVSVGKLPALDADGRFFDSFRDTAEVMQLCKSTGLLPEEERLEVGTGTTNGGLRIARWLTVYAQRCEVRVGSR